MLLFNMKISENNFAFIDSQNLNLNIRNQGWILDFARFRVYLKEKYSVTKAFLFLGYVEENKKLYDFLVRSDYVCIFKPTLEYKDGTTKGNCDAELVLQTMIEYEKYDRAIIVSGDGDFYCLVKYLFDKNKLKAILVPNRLKFSALLKVAILRPYLRYLNDLKERLNYDKKRPHKDETL
ncbi:MAG: NYN domain-containing protein [bacterium]